MNISQRKLRLHIKDIFDYLEYLVSSNDVGLLRFVSEKHDVLVKFNLLEELFTNSSYRLIIQEQRQAFIDRFHVLHCLKVQQLSQFQVESEPSTPLADEPQPIQPPPEVLHKIPTDEEQALLPEYQETEKQKLLAASQAQDFYNYLVCLKLANGFPLCVIVTAVDDDQAKACAALVKCSLPVDSIELLQKVLPYVDDS